MRIYNTGSDRLGTLVIEHLGEELRWKAANYPQPAFSDIGGLFRDINGYWDSLPTARQQGIFDTYKEIHTTLNEVFATNRLITRLQTLCDNLYQLMPIEEIYYWLYNRSGVVFPASLCDRYEENHKKEKTYLRDEYGGLAMLSIALRAMTPVWLEFLQKVTANEERKEVIACCLIARTKLYNSDEMSKLRTLITALASDKQIPMAALISGIGSEDLADWLFAKAVVRRITIGELSQTDTAVNIVSSVHKYVTSCIDQLERQCGGRVHNKYGQSDKDGNTEDNSSNVEAIKPKQEVSPGDTEFFSVYASDALRVAQQIDPTIPVEFVHICLKNLEEARERGMLNYSDHQTILTQWCVATAMSPFAVPYEDAEVGFFNLLAVSQALLWHWGFHNIAMLMAVGCRYRDQFDYSHVETRSRLSRETTQRLMELFPYYKGNKDDQKPRNEVVNAIENISELLSESVWIDQNPAPLRELATISVVEGELVIHGGLKIDLANLAIFIATRSREKV